ncbi:MAG: hypothetical protein OXE87_00160 [Chloroflexi bacterium]|nr:hypothetical protein [Chloroflexota bacterium]
MCFVTDVNALDALCNPTAVAALEAEAVLMQRRDRRNFLDGYRLAVATPLLGLANFVVADADLLGLVHDSRLWIWWNYGNRNGSSPIMSAVSDPLSGVGRLCSAFDRLSATLRVSDRRSRDYGLAETVSAVGTVGTFASLMCNAAAESAIVSLDTGEHQSQIDPLFKLCIAERVSDYMDGTPHYSSAYRLFWRHGEDRRPVDDESVMSAETPLDWVFSLPTGGFVPRKWAKGLGFGFDTILRSAGISLVPNPNPGEFAVAKWFDLFHQMTQRHFPAGTWPSLHYGASEFDQSAVDRALTQLEGDVVAVSPQDRLAAILGPDSVHLQTSAASADFFDFELLLTGMIAMHAGGPVQVLKVTHSVEDDSRDWVSFAIRSPIYGLWSNLSKWYLFYKMYHEGHIGDSDVARAIQEVEALLSRFADDLEEVEHVAGVSDADLLSYCNSQAFDSMKALNRKAIVANADLRARYSELLAGFWLNGHSYHCVKVCLEPASLGKREYDAVGVKDGRCLVIEVKSGSVVDGDLRDQIVRLDGKVRHLRGALPALQRALGCDSAISDVAGLFISLASLQGFDPGWHECELWDRDRFVGELKDVGLPNKIVDLLDVSYIIRSDGFF